MKEVSFRSDGLNIHSTFVMPDHSDEPCPGAITFHGMTSSEAGYVPLVARLAERGIAGLAVTMRGHGKSDGDFHRATVADATSDALAAYDFLAGQPGVDANRIGIIGTSVGAILAAFATTQRSVRSLILRAPAAYTEQMMKLNMAEIMFNESRQFHEITDLQSTPAGNALSQFIGSLLVVASEKDAIIPLSIPKSYLEIAAKSNKKQLIVIKGASHGLTESTWKETFNQAAIDWFVETL